MRFISLIRSTSIKHFQRVIVGCFTVLMLLMLVLAGDNYYNLTSIGSRLGEVVNNNNQKTSLIYNLRDTARERLILLHRIIHERDPFVIDDQIMRHNDLAGKFMLYRDLLNAKLSESIEILEMKSLNQATALAQPAQNKVVRFIQDKKYKQAEEALDIAIVHQEQVIQHLQNFAEVQEDYNKQLSVSSKEELEHSYYLMMVMTLVVILISALTSWFVIRVIASQNSELQNVNTTIELTNRSLEVAIKNAVDANSAKSEFIANMSHELRTPMTSIRGALGMLNSGLVENIPDDAQTMINIADTNSERLMELISDVLDFSKFEAGEIDLIHRNFVVKDEIEKVLIPFTAKTKKKGIAMDVYYESSLPVNITTDLEHVKHIIGQLMNNAVKFTDVGTVELHLGLAAKNKNFMISVKDTGIGIPQDDIQEIFESFIQGDGSSTRKYGGTGIGLAICKKLVTALDGEMGVDSIVGEGSVFWVKIPLYEKQQAA